MEELVSVIIPSYNREKTIIRAIDSVLNQTYKNIEVIVVDDCSSDNTITILKKKYNNISNVIIVQLKKNSGACVARNKGIDISKGKYIAFLDSDDFYYQDKIEKQIKAMKQSGKKVCASSYTRIDEKGKKQSINVVKKTKNTLYNELLYCNFITTGTLIAKAECLKKERFDERLPRYQDWDLVLRLALTYEFELLEEETLFQESQSISITSSTSHKKTFDAMQIILEKNIEGFRKNRHAMTQIQWLMGYHSMFIENEQDYSLLWNGAVGEGINIKRILILIIFKLGLKEKVEVLFTQ